MKSYLKRYLFDGEKLRDRTLDEFAAAMRSGRLIAFVGSYASESARAKKKDAKYPGWGDFLENYATRAKAFVAEAETVCDRQLKRRFEVARKAIGDVQDWMMQPAGDESEKNRESKKTRESEKSWVNALTSLSVIQQVVAYVGDIAPEHKKEFDQRIGDEFLLIDPPPKPNNAALIAALGIDRVITLNYDLEFEWLWMTAAEEKKSGASRRAVLKKLMDDGRIVQGKDPISLIRLLPDGRSVISDVFSRKRTDRLIEFAVGSADYEAHILHLHGLAIAPETMVISQSDYNRQYRRSGVSKLPFEHALRVLFAGNPILFIGVGMSERDVTATLEQIVSDNPDRRIAPAFLLWNAPKQQSQKDAYRFGWLHRFGVLTIFDDEIVPQGQSLAADDERFSKSIANLACKAVDLVQPFPWEERDFRTIAGKLTEEYNKKKGHYDIWPPPHGKEDPDTDLAWAAPKDSARPIRLFISRPGIGKGELARAYRAAWDKLRRPNNPGRQRRSMIINASFVFEIESLFSLISGLGNGVIAAADRKSRRLSLQNYLVGSEDTARILIVINGMERFFSTAGQPLSTELDSLLRAVVRLHNQQIPCPDFQIAIFGSNRVRSYFDALEIRNKAELIEEIDLAEPLRAAPAAKENGAGEPEKQWPSVYFAAVRKAFEGKAGKGAGYKPGDVARFLIDRKRDGDASEFRRYFLGAYLQTEALQAAGVEDADLCFDILTIMAYVGQPIEDVVLFHAPRIQRRLEGAHPNDKKKQGKKLCRAIRDLRSLKLILARAMFDQSASTKRWKRYGLHRSVLTELRDRVGVPLSDSKVSGGFNISLFAAQPIDGYSPEAEIHEELDMLVDWLIGADKDEPLDDYREGAAGKGRETDCDGCARPHASACLRAALALVRNYYSTAALLTLDVTDENDWAEKDGPLAQHGERLDRLIAAAIASAKARRDAPADTGGDEGAPARPALGPPPFYADDLVWLLNERGVVKLAQGDLYEARHAFDEALRLNKDFVEFGDPSHNWRRLMLNQLHVDVERARLDRAEQRIGEIERSLDQGEGFGKISDYVVKHYGEEISSRSHPVDPLYEHDVILTVGLLFGYRGLCLHLNGELKLADEMFNVAVNVLENIGEQRAYAMFQRFAASLKSALGQTVKAAQAIKVAIASSEATRQTDIANLARITEAWQSVHPANPESLTNRAMLIRRLQRSLRYAEAGEMHRVRVEAGLNLARIKFDGGDYDSALERAADAMATATRYGMSLRKISLRILIGQILMRRGDHGAGANLIDRATRNADRVGYQGAVGLAQRVKALEESPGAAPQL